GGAAVAAVAVVVDMGNDDYTLALESASSNSSYDARSIRAIAGQSGCAACSSRIAAAFARSSAAADTLSGDVSYSKPYSSAISRPICSGLFWPGTRRATHQARS